MKALISPNEKFNYQWVSSWLQEEEKWVPVYSEILNCQRIAEVELDNKIFDVSEPLHWLDCPDNCVADLWYYKDGQVLIKPQDVSPPDSL